MLQYILIHKLSLVGLPEKYKDNFDVSSDIFLVLDSTSNYSAIQKLKPRIAVSGRSHEMRRFVCFLFLKQGT